MSAGRLRATFSHMTTMTASPSLTPLHELIDLRGRTAIVTGAARGIGQAISQRLHEAGASVVVADVDLEAAERTARALQSARPDSALPVHTDVSEPADVASLVDTAVGAFGSVEILVNNAGIFPMAPLAQLDLATFRRVVDVNLTGLFMCTKAVSERMIARGDGGRIINITSIDALHPSMIGLAHYDASKHGAWGFTKNAALELAEHRIWVNAIAPGGVLTPGVGHLGEATHAFEAAIPMHRMGQPDDIARVALFLASDLASYITGAQIVVDGGRLLA